MKSAYAILAAVLCLMASPPGFSQSAAPTPTNPLVRAVVTTDFIDIHAGPGRGFPIFHVAEKNAELFVIKEKVNWYKVRTTRDVEGWVDSLDLATAQLPDTGRRVSFGQLEAADRVQRRIELGVSTGKFSGDSLLGVFSGYRFTPYVAAELAWARAPGIYSVSTYTRLGLRAHAYPTKRWSPFLMGGAGKFESVARGTLLDTEAASGTLTQFGVGVNFAADKGFDIRASLLSHSLSGNKTKQFIEWQTTFVAIF